MSNSMMEIFGDVISAYSRAQAIEDGVLVDVTQTANEAGFRLPVAVTRAVWAKYIDWNDADTTKQTIQDTSGRLWDVLWMLYLACRGNRGEASLKYRLYVVPRDGRTKSAKQIELKAVIGGGDDGEPVITVMLPSED